MYGVNNNPDAIEVAGFSELRAIKSGNEANPNARLMAYVKKGGTVLVNGSIEEALLCTIQALYMSSEMGGQAMDYVHNILLKQDKSIQELSMTNDRLRAMVDAMQHYLQLIRDDYAQRGVEMPGLMSSDDMKELKKLVDEANKK